MSEWQLSGKDGDHSNDRDWGAKRTSTFFNALALLKSVRTVPPLSKLLGFCPNCFDITQ
jgi:hypothetical protein